MERNMSEKLSECICLSFFVTTQSIKEYISESIFDMTID